GSLINIPAGGGTNWPPPSFDPETGLFYVNADRGYSLAYLTDTDEKPEGYGGRGTTLLSHPVLAANDYQTREICVRHHAQLRRPWRAGRTWNIDDVRQAAVYWRSGGQSDRIRSSHRQDPVALQDAGATQQRPDDLHAQGPPVSGRGCRRYAVLLCAAAGRKRR